jgi:hypothetical protein
MVYNAQDYWAFGLHPLSGIPKKKKPFGNWICFCPQVRGWETPNLLGPLERANLPLTNPDHGCIYRCVLTALSN